MEMDPLICDIRNTKLSYLLIPKVRAYRGKITLDHVGEACSMYGFLYMDLLIHHPNRDFVAFYCRPYMVTPDHYPVHVFRLDLKLGFRPTKTELKAMPRDSRDLYEKRCLINQLQLPDDLRNLVTRYL